MAGIIVQGAYVIYPGTDFTVQFVRLAGDQLIVLSGATSGTFKVTYKNVTSAAIAYNASPTDMQTALEQMSSIKAGNIAVGGSAGAWDLTPLNQIDAFTFVQNLITVDLTGIPDSGKSVRVTTPALNISTGYTYELHARSVPTSTSPDIQVSTTTSTQGLITLDGANGGITVLVNRATTDVLDFSHLADAPPNGPAPSPGYAGFVLVEQHGGLWQPLIVGTLQLSTRYF